MYRPEIREGFGQASNRTVGVSFRTRLWNKTFENEAPISWSHFGPEIRARFLGLKGEIHYRGPVSSAAGARFLVTNPVSFLDRFCGCPGLLFQCSMKTTGGAPAYSSELMTDAFPPWVCY